jgi:hypothetical protein
MKMTAAELRHYDIDDALADTFPASDPPAWNPGIARPTPAAIDATRAAVPHDRARSPILGPRAGGVDPSRRGALPA